MDSINDFSADFLQRAFTATQTNNVVASPMSIASLLYILWIGARGQTQEGISRVLKLTNQHNINTYQTEFTKIIDKLQTDPLIKNANKIFINEHYNITEEFQHWTEKINFENGYQSAANINKWVESLTNGKIKQLIDQSVINPNTIMIMLNALYFKGLWTIPFTSTREASFQNIDGSSSTVTMMNEISRYRHVYLREYQAEALELSYQNSDIVMVICLPNKPNGLSLLVNRLPEVQRNLLNARFEEKYMTATLPKFKVETSLNLKNLLSELGMSQAFTDAADFGNLLQPGSGPTKVSTAVQKTFVEIDEKGTEAASGSGVVIIPRMSLEEFYCDRPFLFFIYHKSLRIPILAGVIRSFK